MDWFELERAGNCDRSPFVLCIFFDSCLIRCLLTRDKVARQVKPDYNPFVYKSTTIEFTNVDSDVNGSLLRCCNDQSGLVCARRRLSNVYNGFL